MAQIELPKLSMKAPIKIWLYYPENGGPPVLWTDPRPFPFADTHSKVEYKAVKTVK